MDAQPTGSGETEAMPYEAARDELLDVVRRLEAGGLPLETSLALWERGEVLAGICQAWLDGARERLAAGRPTAGGPAEAAAGSGEPDDDG